MKLIIGAYATTPKPFTQASDEAYYAGLRAIKNFGGFEVPLLDGGVMHHADEAWLLTNLATAAPEQYVIVSLQPAPPRSTS